MSRTIRLALTAFAAAMFVYAAGSASAQAQVKQIKLTETPDRRGEKAVVEDLTEQLKPVQPIMHPSNIEPVKKYFDRLAPLVK